MNLTAAYDIQTGQIKTSSPYKYSPMLDFCIYPGVTQYIMYLSSHRRKNIKIATPIQLQMPDDSTIKHIFEQLGCEHENTEVPVFEIMQLSSPVQYKNLRTKFQKICDDNNLIYVGFTNNYIVTLDAKGNLASANAYLKSCGTINKKAHIMQIVVTDEIPKNSPPLIRPIGWSKEFMYKYKPDTSAPENYNTESHACIYDVSGQAVAYTSKHQTFLDKLNEFLSTQKNP